MWRRGRSELARVCLPPAVGLATAFADGLGGLAAGELATIVLGGLVAWFLRPRCRRVVVAGDDLAGVEAREAARILATLVTTTHVARETEHGRILEIDTDVETFDRLCLWGVATEGREDDGD